MGIQKRNTKEEEIAAARAKAAARATAEVMAARAAKAAKHEDILARTSLADMLEMAGFRLEERGNYPRYRHPDRARSIVINGDGEWFDNLAGIGGGGEFGVAMLAKHLGIDLFGNSPAPARQLVATRPVEPAKPAAIPPSEVAENWRYARDYLVSTRRIPASVVDSARAAGLIYCDAKKYVVFIREGGVFIRSTWSEWRQSIGIGAAPFVVPGDGRLYLCEAPIDALSLLSINPGATVAATGGGFCVARVAKLIEQAEVVHLSFDNDTAGLDDNHKIRDGLPKHLHKMVDHQPPPGIKDWNMFLTG